VKRALWVVGLVPNKMGGFERTCAEFARQALRRGTVAEFIFEGEPCASLALELNAARAAYSVIPDVGALGWKHAVALWRHLRKERPDVVHMHFCAFYVPFFLLLSLLRIPLVATYHYSGEPKPASPGMRLLKKLRLRVFSGTLRHISAVSEAARVKFLGDYLERPELVTVIYNGTDIAQRPKAVGADNDRDEAVSTSGPKVLFIGSLSEEKGVEFAIRAVGEAAEAYSTITLSIAGEGSERNRLAMLTSELGIGDRVAFLGLREDIREILAQHDMLLMPSIWKEAFGYVLIEAMAAGCPVIASAVGGIPEIVVDGREGLLVPPADVSALARAITQLWSSPQLRRTLVSNALQKVRERFSMSQIVNEYWLLYD
jgi:glycosyltransferase involved in cell wall biosynthesis